MPPHPFPIPSPGATFGEDVRSWCFLAQHPCRVGALLTLTPNKTRAGARSRGLRFLAGPPPGSLGLVTCLKAGARTPTATFPAFSHSRAFVPLDGSIRAKKLLRRAGGRGRLPPETFLPACAALRRFAEGRWAQLTCVCTISTPNRGAMRHPPPAPFP